MAQQEKILSYPEHKVFKIVNYASRDVTQDQCKRILTQCLEKNSTLIIFTGQVCVILPSTEFMKVRQLSGEEQERFLTYGSEFMKSGVSLSIKTPTHVFSNN